MTYCRKATGPNVGNAVPLQVARRGTSRLSTLPWAPSKWRNYLAAGESESRLAVIRQRTHTGLPLGSAEFVHSMERLAQRRLAPQKRGPREKVVIDRSQGELAFEP